MEQNIKDTDVRLMSMSEVCERLGISLWAVNQQIEKRTLKSVRIGKRRMVSTRALNEFITTMEQ